MKRRPHDIVEVSWADSCSKDTRWQETKDFLGHKTVSLECRTVGYLLFNLKDRIGLAGSLSLGDDIEHIECHGIVEVGGTMTIPKSAILEIRVLSKGIPE